ncbi:zinc ribbon domain-containing protein [Oscillatoria sp. FACHB-1406]|uniref:zinc ribbon domain-containing protein n=1 Tax=Oscillatoria sp. FACHB-1406 TaxID=2692846 RepID=UPI0016883A91|nr:zinc ribbon domain-containing protein [Oscillatoria sp. FACHB-1406]MBD2577562.1 zinc ribbon domain-containing protein [Oscillatoria sp. FACHB-1406]
MFAYLRRLIRRFVRKSTYIDREPINKVSIVILILIDIFVLVNVFSGLSSIAAWPLSPDEQLFCYAPYRTYQEEPKKSSLAFQSATIEQKVQQLKNARPNSISRANRLGEESPLCDPYKSRETDLNVPENNTLLTEIDRLRASNSKLEQEITTLQSQYDSALLEKIAGQDRTKSINVAAADKIKSDIEVKKTKISDNKKQLIAKQQQLIQTPSSAAYLALLDNTAEYQNIEKAYNSASFWYPNQQLFLQVLFLLPLIAIAYLLHSTATRRHKGLQSLLSWHLLLIFCIPLLIKFFEFIQFGNIVAALLEVITTLLGGLLFVASYALILVIPLLGFALIKLLQTFVFNSRIQARNRLKNVRCLHCNFKLRLDDEFCPNCGFDQYQDCSNCHEKTYKFVPFCRKCGHSLNDTQPLDEV